MLLELPNEMLTHISTFLSPEDNSTLRKTCRHLRAVVDSNGIFPMSPERVEIDFLKEVIVTTQKGTRIGVVNGNLCNDHRHMECRSDFLQSKTDVFCDVGWDWKNYLERYLKKLNKYSKLNLHRPHPAYEVMSPVLENWVAENLPSETLFLGFVCLPTDFKKYKNVPKFTCITTGKAASYALKRLYLADVGTRKFFIPVGGRKFPASVQSVFGVDLKDLPFQKPTWKIPFGLYTVKLRRVRISGTSRVKVGGIEMIEMTIERNARQ